MACMSMATAAADLADIARPAPAADEFDNVNIMCD